MHDPTLSEFQQFIRDRYQQTDQARGPARTFLWFSEEIGELAKALARRERGDGDEANLREEFADVLAWLTTIANVAEVDLSEAVQKKYGPGCPGCGQYVCRCSDHHKP